MRKFLLTSFMCFAISVPSVMFAQDGGDKKKEETKKEEKKEEKKECKDDSCKKPEKEK